MLSWLTILYLGRLRAGQGAAEEAQHAARALHPAGLLGPAARGPAQLDTHRPAGPRVLHPHLLQLRLAVRLITIPVLLLGHAVQVDKLALLAHNLHLGCAAQPGLGRPALLRCNLQIVVSPICTISDKNTARQPRRRLTNDTSPQKTDL